MTGLYKYGTSFLMLLLSLLTAAQPRVEAKLDSVPRDGFYRIPVSPALTGYARADFSDVRLRDERGQSIPYLIDTVYRYAATRFLDYDMTSAGSDTAGMSYILRAPAESSDHIDLVFANTRVRRRAQLSGSYDGKQWYSIDDALYISPTAAGQTGYATQQVRFPFNKYPYLRLRIQNEGYSPLRLLQAGQSVGGTYAGDWVNAGRLRFDRRDSSGYTRIRLYNPDRYLLEKLELFVSSPQLFRRDVSIHTKSGASYPARVVETGFTFLSLPGIKDSLLLVDIRNGDNPPLQVDSIRAAFGARAFIAFLEGGKTYQLEAGDTALPAPDFDIAAFRSRIRVPVPDLHYGSFRIKPGHPATGNRSNDRVWIWIALVAGIGMLAGASVSLLREVRKEKKEDNV